MSEPFYVIRIEGTRVSCLGEQLIEILEEIRPLIENLMWYTCHNFATTKVPHPENYEEFIPIRVGNSDAMIDLCRNVDQFESAVFLGLPSDYGDSLNHEYFTKDEEFRDHVNTALEIIAFDTQYYEINSRDFNIIKKLSSGIINNELKIKNYSLRFRNKDINSRYEQLVKILDWVWPFITAAVWYSCDLEEFKSRKQGFELKRIGSSCDFMDFSKNIDHCLPCMFFALPLDWDHQSNRKYVTYDELFRNVENSILQICAFNPSYFDIETSSYSIMEVISEKINN
ncbi:MAG: hypothetical protein JSR46_06385 [Verrucomicrobia bacterium]|nr:hypothetical protein [Verrucomicrobiota bacterium]